MQKISRKIYVLSYLSKLRQNGLVLNEKIITTKRKRKFIYISLTICVPLWGAYNGTVFVFFKDSVNGVHVTVTYGKVMMVTTDDGYVW